MCIIAVKPAGVEWPTWNTLRQCWERNPDGAVLFGGYGASQSDNVVEDDVK